MTDPFAIPASPVPPPAGPDVYVELAFAMNARDMDDEGLDDRLFWLIRQAIPTAVVTIGNVEAVDGTLAVWVQTADGDLDPRLTETVMTAIAPVVLPATLRGERVTYRPDSVRA